MSLSQPRATFRSSAMAIACALVASLFVIAEPLATQSKADYTSFTSYTNDGAITYNDRVCNLGDPNDHSSSATAFEISTSEQLWEVTDCVSNSATIFFELANDIDVSGSTAPTTSPIGFSTSSVAYSFSGVLDGKDKNVSALSMSTTTNVGLFSLIENATFSNLVIAGSIESTAGYAGALAAVSKGNLSLLSVVNEASVSGNGFGTGGLIGQINGGVVLIESSSNLGNVESSKNRVGGLIGESFATSLVVSSSQNLGKVTAANVRVGGLIGDAGTVTIRNSHNSGMVEGAGSVGGLVGNAFVNFGVGAKGDVAVETSSNSGSVSATTGASAGGLVGSTDGSVTVRSSQNSGTISASTNRAGGLVGYAAGNANISQGHNIGAISAGTDEVGGLLGRVQLNLVSDSSYNNGPISGYQHLGGLVGMANGNAQISASHNTGTVSGTSRMGGLAGSVQNNGNVISSYNSGLIDGTDDLGGLMGYVQLNSVISYSYNTGTLLGSNRLGGLVGYVQFGNSSRLDFSYNVGMVSGSSNADGLAGQVSSLMTTSAFSSVPSDFVATSTVGDLRLASGFAGFDFDNVWGFGTCNENNGYPMLRIFAQVDSYYTIGCYTAPVADSVEAPTPTPVYSGPVIDSALKVKAGSEVTFTGNRLASVTAAFVGGVKLSVITAERQSLVLGVASTLSPGTYDLVLQSSFGTLTFQQGLTVLASSTEKTETETSTEPEQMDRKLTVGALDGFVAIYSKGYEGKKLSAKVAGKWLVVSGLDESWNGNNYSRTLRAAGAGFEIKVQLYIDGKFMRTERVTTR